eukprot:m51a1_g4086 hypothetical protein (220) ;mRNA; r:38486-39398
MSCTNSHGCHCAAPDPLASPCAVRKTCWKGIIFDMDGTLTQSFINFTPLRTKLGITRGEDILLAISRLSEPERAEAEALLDSIEARAVSLMQLQPRLAEVFGRIDELGIPKALVTRNRRRAVDAFVREANVSFDVIIARDCKPDPLMPDKPDPAPVLHICSRWGVDPSEVMVVGDFSHDVDCGRAAGSVTVLLVREYNKQFAPAATYTINQLYELVDLL